MNRRIRDAFERAYGARYYRPGLEDRVMASVFERRERDRGRGRLPLLAATVAAVALAALAVGTLQYLARATRPGPAPAGSPAPVVSETPAPTPSATPTPLITPTPTAGTAAQGCTVDQLTARMQRAGAASGSASVQFVFQNHSEVTCTLYGFPGLQRLDAQGRPMPTSVIRGSNVVVQPERPALVTLRPGGEASFIAGFADDPTLYNLSCPSSAQIEVTPPNETRFLVVPFQFNPVDRGVCGGVTVSPVYAGTGPQPPS